MSKHTPGPWVRDGKTLIIRAASNRYEVARVHCNFAVRGKDGLEEFEYAEGNARLIAAAPEMLEALRIGVACHTSAAYPADLAVALDRMRAAIAKAEGRE